MYKCVWISKQLIVLNSFVYSNFNYCLLIWHFGSNNFKLEINTRTSSQNCIALSIPLKERLGAPSSSPVVWASLHVGCHPLFFPPKNWVLFLSFMSHLVPSLIANQILDKRHLFLPALRIFSLTIMTKNSLELSLLI